MVPTNEERRKAAASLRKVSGAPEWATTACCIAEMIGEYDYPLWDSSKPLFDCLADLIEPEPINGETSDGYHTFNELYHHRALLFSVIVRNYPELCWKSKKHHTGDMYDGMFIVGINTPDGQASYHYDIEPYWDMFDCEELELAPEWDGHTPAQAIERIGKLARHEQKRICKIERTEQDEFGIYDYLSCGHIAMRQWPEKTQYCSKCGAKVVEQIVDLRVILSQLVRYR